MNESLKKIPTELWLVFFAFVLLLIAYVALLITTGASDETIKFLLNSVGGGLLALAQASRRSVTAETVIQQESGPVRIDSSKKGGAEE